jgi:hypothetical protein
MIAKIVVFKISNLLSLSSPANDPDGVTRISAFRGNRFFNATVKAFLLPLSFSAANETSLLED